MINRRSRLLHLLCDGLVGDVKEPTSLFEKNRTEQNPVKVGALHGFHKPLCAFSLGHSCPRKLT